MKNKRKVIIITDGDRCAQKTIEMAVGQIGGRCISKSGGNPTPLSGAEIVNLVKEAKNDPVVVMTDDEGNENTGIGERALQKLLTDDEIEVMGIIAVASNTEEVEGVHVDFSIDENGSLIENAVDKNGVATSLKVLYGDTVDIIEKCPKPPIIVGLGDIGKMNGKDDRRIGAPILTKALKVIMEGSSNRV
ncbi:stage V sporulation protein AE [Alkaliphilus pronyensis]|uniref:Stage V sporulation protein AE n=1 Tax=Alkaliphilus pronyensis TaxID=1482732 RepID=A0A6I0F9D7_9FIRM|nr:stage V sporulation protein AE [Alkaliphilus pronyensis]KAB3532792.1 stage V sporulation protein AE [Alkaliphilus pronyensis]